MTEATELVLKQWGAFGAVLVILGLVIAKLWTVSFALTKSTIDTLTADNKALTTSLAECNEKRITDHGTFTAQILAFQRDTVSGLANATNTAAAASSVLEEVKVTMRDTAEELRRRRGG